MVLDCAHDCGLDGALDGRLKASHCLIDSILASLALALIDNQISHITVVEKRPTS